jgi:hypothetical protein
MIDFASRRCSRSDRETLSCLSMTKSGLHSRSHEATMSGDMANPGVVVGLGNPESRMQVNRRKSGVVIDKSTLVRFGGTKGHIVLTVAVVTAQMQQVNANKPAVGFNCLVLSRAACVRLLS